MYSVSGPPAKVLKFYAWAKSNLKGVDFEAFEAYSLHKIVEEKKKNLSTSPRIWFNWTPHKN